MWPAPAGEGVQRAAAIAPPRIGLPMGLGAATGGGQGGAATAAVVPPKRITAEVSVDFVERLRAWWAGGGKVLIASDGSLKKIRVPRRKELVPQGSTGWVYGLAPADFPEDEPNETVSAVEWLGSSGKSIDLSPWMTLSSFICETAATAGAIAHLAQACVQGV